MTQGLGGKPIHEKKTRSRKSRDTVPLRWLLGMFPHVEKEIKFKNFPKQDSNMAPKLKDRISWAQRVR